MVTVSVERSVSENGKEVILLPLPAAGAADGLHVLTYGGFEAYDWPVYSDSNLPFSLAT
jgi:hypothetical protein